MLAPLFVGRQHRKHVIFNIFIVPIFYSVSPSKVSEEVERIQIIKELGVY